MKNPHYVPNKSNGYNPPECKDKRVMYIEADCGKCWECRRKKAREWSVRIQEEIKVNKGYFITLTLNEDSMSQLRKELKVRSVKGNENLILKTAHRRMLERIRKETGKSVKHWCVTELGEEKGRAHIHGIYFGKGSEELVTRHWKYGNTFTGKYVSARTANYITKYMSKTDIKHLWFTGRVLCSAGIGRNYTDNNYNNVYREKKTLDVYVCRNGQKIALPYYWRTKLFTIEQREQLWKWKQENPYTWIAGERLLKESYFEQYALIKYYQNYYKTIHGDNEEMWAEQKKANKLARKREAYKKLEKELQKKAKTDASIEAYLLNRAKLRKIIDESHCKFKKYSSTLKRKSKEHQLKLQL